LRDDYLSDVVLAKARIHYPREMLGEDSSSGTASELYG